MHEPNSKSGDELKFNNELRNSQDQTLFDDYYKSDLMETKVFLSLPQFEIDGKTNQANTIIPKVEPAPSSNNTNEVGMDTHTLPSVAAVPSISTGVSSVNREKKANRLSALKSLRLGFDCVINDDQGATKPTTLISSKSYNQHKVLNQESLPISNSQENLPNLTAKKIYQYLTTK